MCAMETEGRPRKSIIFLAVPFFDHHAGKVLARYPPDASLPCDNVADYCFPQGVRAARMDARESQSSLNKVLYQPGACQRGSQSFVFMFSGDGLIEEGRSSILELTK